MVDRIHCPPVSQPTKYHRRIFIEHHCGLKWSTVGRIQAVVEEARQRHRSMIQLRSFTVLRSPAALAASQFRYWHKTNKDRKGPSGDVVPGLPPLVFYEFARELLLFRDPFRSPIGEKERSGRDPAGGIFLDLAAAPGVVPTLDWSSVPSEQAPAACSAPHWAALCRQYANHMVHVCQHHAATEARLRKDEDEGADGASSPTPQSSPPPARAGAELQSNATGPAGRSGCLVPRGNGGFKARTVESVRAAGARKAELYAARAQALQNLTSSPGGCSRLLHGALTQLSSLTHVFFMEAEKLSLRHVAAIGAEGTLGQIESNRHNGASLSDIDQDYDPRRLDRSIVEANRCAFRLYRELYHRLAAASQAFSVMSEEAALADEATRDVERADAKRGAHAESGKVVQTPPGGTLLETASSPCVSRYCEERIALQGVACDRPCTTAERSKWFVWMEQNPLQ